MPGFGVGGRRGSSRPAAAAAPAAAVLAIAMGVVACGGGSDEAFKTGATGSSPVEAPASEPTPMTSAPTDAAVSTSTTTGPATTTPPPPEVAPTTAEAEAADPVRVVIPAIDVDAPVIPLGVQASGALEVPADFAETGWWRDGPEPGEAGPAVIAGHVDSTRGPAVFYRLRELRTGDAVEVARSDGSRVGFVVGRVEQHPKDAFPTASVYGDTAGPELRLVTCGGVFDRATGHYVDNVIAFATPA